MSASGATERLYYTDSYLTAFDASVIDRSGDGTRVYLDRTAFYPTSGGQLHDVGVLGGQPVIDVVDESDRIAHVFAAPVSLAGKVGGHVDWSRRFDHMQQHTGQHLLSAVFEDLLGAKTVSVHFGEATSTLDLETDSLSPQSIEKAERRANMVVAENRPVTVSFEEATAAHGLRKASDRTGTLRVVTIADVDRSACGGTHVRATGEIGSIMVRGTERTKKAVRVEFVCGLRAVARARADYQALSAIAVSLSTSIDSAAPLAISQAAQLRDAEKARRNLERTVGVYQAREMYDRTEPSSDGVRVIGAESDVAMDTLRAIGMAIMETPRAAFFACSTEGQVIVTTSEDSGRDAGRVLREVIGKLGGKGGGSPRLAQGSVPREKSDDARLAIRAALEPGR